MAIKNLKLASFYPHKYGPYSEEVEQKKNDLIREGYLRRINNTRETLTVLGREKYKEIISEANNLKNKIYLIKNIKELVNAPIKDEVLAVLIYDIAEKLGYTFHSEIKSKIEKNRLKYAILLYKKKKDKR